MQTEDVILGAGMTGLAAGWASGMTTYESEQRAGGICRSYYIVPGSGAVLPHAPADGSAYRFEVGGGHWIFGGSPIVLRFMSRFTAMKRYRRRAVVFFPEQDLTVPYPLQYHLSYLGKDIAAQALEEMRNAPPANGPTLAAWIEQAFGPTLAKLFFGPFHDAYTAGLWTSIAPQDGYKSPVDIRLAEQGAAGEVQGAGYNAEFIYPESGLAHIADAIAAATDVRYDHEVTAVDATRREMQFRNGSGCRYSTLISTAPLDRMLKVCQLDAGEEPAPHTSVLVLNIGAVRGPKCPDAHWVYLPRSSSGFHRIGFYSNVEADFLPRGADNRVSLYVERAYPGPKPGDAEVETYSREAVSELRRWGFIGEVDVVDPSWVEVAYTWSRPASRWRERAIQVLAARDVVMVGRYATWQFQGIADSIRDGLLAGSALRREPASGAAV